MPASARNQKQDAGGNTAAAFIAEQSALGRKPNALINEKSPYLLQHAFNPVQWLPWGEEAFARARREDKPIFLSIGYSTCHWCHVMARESFSDPAAAEVLNQYFVCIKVDREERPDLDRIYMSASQALTGGGGWPNSVFLTPDRKPFYAGTYFPPRPGFGLPSFRQVLEAVRRSWEQNRRAVLSSAEKITAVLERLAAPGEAAGALPADLPERAFAALAGEYDAAQGGFGPAPKFPRPMVYAFLLRYYHHAREPRALEMTLSSLGRMAAGGVHDQAGGGFHRYAVDGQWRTPHFEKMLYDQAGLAAAYLEAYQAAGEPWLAEVARGVLDYVSRDLTDPRGGFYSAEDADSPLPDNPREHGEGAFYLWTQEELEAVLGPETSPIFNYHYGVKKAGNALADPQGEFRGRNILYAAHAPRETAARFQLTAAQVEALLARARTRLREVRSRRPRPLLDDKIITSWNGLMISAFSRGAQVLGEGRYLEAARRAAGFILKELYDPQARVLQRRWRDGEAGLAAGLTDYAFLAQGLIDLYEASLEIVWLERALELTETLSALFGDEKAGGFFETSGRDQSLLLRGKESYESARPAGASAAVLNLLRLSQMTHNEKWRREGAAAAAAFGRVLERSPQAMPQMLAAQLFLTHQTRQIVLETRPGDRDWEEMQGAVHGRFLPNKIIILADHGRGHERLGGWAAFLKQAEDRQGRAAAYVYEDYARRLSADDPRELARLLDAK